MRFTQSWLAVSVIVTAMTLPGSSWAKSDLDMRITRLENIVNNELNIELINKIDTMQQEICELRGKLEEQQNSVQALNQKQDKLFVNLDSRLNSLTNPESVSTAITEPTETQETIPSAPTAEIPEQTVNSLTLG